jgi:outer membrane protein OmpA-like peptidoglycan-associated protein
MKRRISTLLAVVMMLNGLVFGLAINETTSTAANAANTDYLPNENEGFFSTNAYQWQVNDNNTYMLSRHFVKVGILFYKLNKATREAMVAGYDHRIDTGTALVIPETIEVTAATIESETAQIKTDFSGTYVVTYIGRGSFKTNGGDSAPATPMDADFSSITLPNTIKVIGGEAFFGQCMIREFVIPDSVTDIGTDAFLRMDPAEPHITQCSNANIGLRKVVIGSKVSRFYTGAFGRNSKLETMTIRADSANFETPTAISYPSSYDKWQYDQGSGNGFITYQNSATNTCTDNIYRLAGASVTVQGAFYSGWTRWATNCFQTAAAVTSSSFTPNQPDSPTAVSRTLTSVTVNVNTQTADGGSPITNYLVTANPGGAFANLSGASGGNVLISGLTSSTNYTFKVIATNAVGNSIPSISSAQITTLSPSAPSAPTIGTASVAGATSASVTFTAPTNNGGATIDSYTATSSPGGFTGTLLGSAAGSITVSGLTQGTTYTFTVKAYNSAGASSSSSASNSVVPQVLSGPAFTSNTITGSKVVGQTLTANPVATGVPNPTYTYQWKRGGADISGATSSTYLLTTADGGNSISVSVTATNGSGSATNISAETAPIPRVAQTITFASLASPKITARSVTLGVTTGYGLATASSGLTPTYTSGTPALCSTTVAGVIQLLGVGTCSIIAAQDGSANYGKADTVTASLIITADVPSAPSINSVSTSGASGSGSITVALTKGSNNGAAIDSFTVIATTGGIDTSIVVAASAAETATVTVTGLTIGSAYTVAIKARNAAGWSVTTSYGSAVTPADAPYAVTALRSTQNGPNQLTVNFTPPSSLSGGNFTSYQYFITPRGNSFSGTPTSTSTVGAPSSSAPADPGYTFTGLTALAAYDVKVVVTTVGNGAALAAATALLNQVPSAAPNAPSVTLSQTDSQTVRMDWRTSGSNGSAITSYAPTLLVDGSSQTCTNSFNIEGSYCTVTGLLGGQVVTASATATNAIGASPAGTATSVTIIGLVGAPTSLVATPGNGQLSIAFALVTNGDRVINFAYSVDGTNYLGVEGTSSPVVISGLTNGTAYSIYLKAVGANNGIGSASAAVTGTPIAPATGPAPVVLGPPPSTFVVVANPKISRSGSSYVCTSGTYKFKKQGGKEEASSITSQQISLLSNGAVVDSEKTLESQSTFEGKSSYKGTTLSCEVGIKQEEVVKTYSSIDVAGIASYEAAMTAAIYGANTTYFSERDAAYMKRDAGDTKLWKEMLDKALVKREDTKVQAGVDYLANLEKAGISILIAPDKAAPAPIPSPTPTPTPTKSPDVSITGNVQPAAMKKVGTIYFASGTYFLNDESKRTIKALATSIFMKSPTTVLSYGFTDSKGGTDNTVLSQNRAKAVAKLLRSLLPGQKIATGWYASSKPVATGNSKAALAQNRRVEIYVK